MWSIARLARARCAHLPHAQPPAGRRGGQSRCDPATTRDLPGSLVARYGAESPNVIASARCERPTDPVAAGIDVTRAEFEFAVTHEGALTVDDIVDRRTRIGLVAPTGNGWWT